MGISVKSRSRNEGKEGQYLSIPNANFQKVDAACVAFGWKPYFAIVVDEENWIKVYILSQEKLLQYFPMKNKVSGWKMTKVWQQKYNDDKDIVKIEFEFGTKDWWK